MTLNLDELKKEVLAYMEAEGFVVFHGYSRLAATDSFVAWDSDRLPDYRAFLGAAKKSGAKMIVYHFREFSAAHLAEAAEQIEDGELEADEQRDMERRLRKLRSYEGFTCALELSFDHEGRIYLFNLRAEWYDDYLDLMEELEVALPEGEDGEDGPMGGYYSQN